MQKWLEWNGIYEKVRSERYEVKKNLKSKLRAKKTETKPLPTTPPPETFLRLPLLLRYPPPTITTHLLESVSKHLYVDWQIRSMQAVKEHGFAVWEMRALQATPETFFNINTQSAFGFIHPNAIFACKNPNIYEIPKPYIMSTEKNLLISIPIQPPPSALVDTLPLVMSEQNSIPTRNILKTVPLMGFSAATADVVAAPLTQNIELDTKAIDIVSD